MQSKRYIQFAAGLQLQVVLVVRIRLQCRTPGFNPWFGTIPWRRACNPLQYSCLENPMDKEPGGISPWGGKESDRT